MSPDRLTLAQREKLEAAMNIEFGARLSESLSRAKQIEALDRRVWFWKIIAGLAILAAIMVAIVGNFSRPKFGPFKVGYFPNGLINQFPLGSDSSVTWDHCQAYDGLQSPILCIWAPAPMKVDNSAPEPTPIPSSTPKDFARKPTAVVASYPLQRPPVTLRRLPLGVLDVPHPYPPSPSGSVVGAAEGTVDKIIKAAGLCGVPESIAVRLAARESGQRHLDKHGKVLRSRSGAMGIFQVKATSAAEVSASLKIEEEWDNMLAGLCLLSKYYGREGSWQKALLDYRAGPSRKETTAAHYAYAKAILEGY